MREITNVTLFACDHCGKKLRVKGAALRHEERCSKNPDNKRACFGCKHLIAGTAVIQDDHSDFGNRSVRLLKCLAKSQFVYPPIVEHKGNAIEIGDLNEPMPRECDLFEPEFSFDK